MKKQFIIAAIFTFFILGMTSCNSPSSQNQATQNSSMDTSAAIKKEEQVQSDSQIQAIEHQSTVFEEDKACTFETDHDLLTYLIGKSFSQSNGSISISFNETGAMISGIQYQWITYNSLGGYKGKVKLASIDPSNPDGTITLFISCKEKAVTDGETVLLLNE